MTEEETKPPEAPKETETPQEPSKKPIKQKRAEKDIDTAETLEHKSLDEKMVELEKLEKKIDKKRANLKTLIADAEFHGKSEGTKPSNQEEAKKQAANAFLASTGLKAHLDVE